MAEQTDDLFELFKSRVMPTQRSGSAIIRGGNQRDELSLNALDDLLEPEREDADLEVTPEISSIEKRTTVKTTLGSARSEKKLAFPVSDVASLPGYDDLSERMLSLTRDLSEGEDYSTVRDEYCVLSILLNLQGLNAPAFRPLPKITAPKGNSAYMAIHRDQVVIDCHWLHCKCEPIDARDAEYQPIFDHDRPFRFDLAWKFAIQTWGKEHRIDEALSLTPRLECQLAAMRGDCAKELTNAALHGIGRAGGSASKRVGAVRKAINQWCERDKRIFQYRKDYANLWLAKELLGAAAPPSRIAVLLGLIDGTEPRNEKTIRDKLKKLNRHVGEV